MSGNPHDLIPALINRHPNDQGLLFLMLSLPGNLHEKGNSRDSHLRLPAERAMSHLRVINAARDSALLSDTAADPRTDGDINEFSLKRRTSVKLSQCPAFTSVSI